MVLARLEHQHPTACELDLAVADTENAGSPNHQVDFGLAMKVPGPAERALMPPHLRAATSQYWKRLKECFHDRQKPL